MFCLPWVVYLHCIAVCFVSVLFACRLPCLSQHLVSVSCKMQGQNSFSTNTFNV